MADDDDGVIMPVVGEQGLQAPTDGAVVGIQLRRRSGARHHRKENHFLSGDGTITPSYRTDDLLMKKREGPSIQATSTSYVASRKGAVRWLPACFKQHRTASRPRDDARRRSAHLWRNF
jgi:hypothetical protein